MSIPRRGPTDTSSSLHLAAVLALVGGFLDAYTYVSRDGVFANSQTGNIVLFGVEAARGKWLEASRHLPPIVAFLAGVGVAETLKRPRVVGAIRWPARGALVLEIGVLLVVGALPATVPNMVVTVSVAFVASLQVSMFRTLIKWPFTTTMTTGNLRTAAQALYKSTVEHDPDAAIQARTFGSVIAAFLGGALVGAHVTLRLGARAGWIAAAVLGVALALFVLDDWLDRRSSSSRARAAGKS